jgi:tRNA G18 (ribose-2'-O)-methylase SpoU
MFAAPRLATKASLHLLRSVARDRAVRQRESVCVVESIAVLKAALAAPRVAHVDDLFVSDDSVADLPMLSQLMARSKSSRVWRVESRASLQTDVSEPPSLAAIVHVDPSYFQLDSFASWLQATRHERSTVLVLSNLSNPVNVGALLRSAAAFGAGVIVSGQQSADVLNSKTVRASAGALFSLGALWVERDEARVVRELRAADYEIAGTVASRTDSIAVVDLAAVRALPRVAFLLGSEAHGLDAATLERAAVHVRITTLPCVQSLNVAVAGSLLLHDRFQPPQR